MIQPYPVLSCDTRYCSAKQIAAPNTKHEELRATAQLNGWVHIDGKDYCPDCKVGHKPVKPKELV